MELLSPSSGRVAQKCSSTRLPCQGRKKSGGATNLANQAKNCLAPARRAAMLRAVSFWQGLQDFLVKNSPRGAWRPGGLERGNS